MNSNIHSKETGSSIVAVLLVIVTLAVFSISAFHSTMTRARNVERTNTYREAMNVGDGALELAFSHWREISRQRSNIARPGSAYAGLAAPTSTMFNRIPNFTASTGPNPSTGTPFTVANFKIQAVDPQFNVVDQNAAPPTGTGMS